MTEPQIKPTPPTPLTREEWDDLHSKLFDQTKDQFFVCLEQFGWFNWPLPRLIAWILG
jgi:hypothetical protein